MNQTRDLSGKTFVITGANTGIGRANVEALAARGAGRIVIAARSRERTEPAIAAISAASPETDVRFVTLELGDLASVKRAADEILAMDLTIDVLINNAGIAGLQGLTKDGFELTFGTNHLGPFLFTERLLPHVKRAPQGRIVNVSSRGHYRAKRAEWEALRQRTKTMVGLPEYAFSKLCNVLYAKELSRRLADTKVTTYALNPGGVASDIWQRRMGKFAVLLRPFLITNEQGALTQLRCETDPALARQTGLYYDKERPKDPSMLAQDVALQDELTARSRKWVEAYLA